MKNYKFKVKRNARKNILGMRVMFKKCSKCGEVLFKGEFAKRKEVPSGLTSHCKRCVKDCKKPIKHYKKTCKECGKRFDTTNYRKVFCSKDCQNASHSRNMTGKKNPSYNGGGIKCNCDYCNKEIEITKARYNKSKNHFCSTECLGKWKSENQIGENNPFYKEGSYTTFNCDYCGKESKDKTPYYNKKKTHYCSCECMWKHRSVLYSGENHPNYDPTKTQEEREKDRNIEGYNDFIKSVYERDNYTCQCCGDNKGGNLNAHHIFGYSEYKDLRTDVDNGVALCEDCHKKYHKQYGYKNNNYKDFRTFLYNEMMKQNTLEAKLFYINTIEDITLRLEIRGLLGLESA